MIREIIDQLKHHLITSCLPHFYHVTVARVDIRTCPTMSDINNPKLKAEIAEKLTVNTLKFRGFHPIVMLVGLLTVNFLVNHAIYECYTYVYLDVSIYEIIYKIRYYIWR